MIVTATVPSYTDDEQSGIKYAQSLQAGIKISDRASDIESERHQDLFAMLITREREKLLNALIFFSGNVLHPGKTKLFKLLNYLDFLHFEKTGRGVTGLQYYAWNRGPVPVDLYEELKHPKKDFIEHLLKTTRKLPGGFERQELKARKKFDDKFFSPFELSLMESLAKRHFQDNAEQISEYTHFETGPWHEVHEIQKNVSGEIPYDLVLLRRGNIEDMEILELSQEYKELESNYG